MKIKKKDYKFLSLVLLLVFAISVSVVSIVKANTSEDFYNDIVDSTSTKLADAIYKATGISLGALTNANAIPSNLDDGEWTAWNDGYFDDLEIADDLLVIGDTSFTGTLSIGDLDTVITSGALATKATGTVFVLNPFGATSTVDLMIYTVDTPATSSMDTYCATSSNPNTNVLGTQTNLINASIASNTPAHLLNDTTQDAQLASSSIGVTVGKLLVGPGEYISCTAIGDIDSRAILGDNSPMSGTYLIRWLRFSP